MWLLQVAGGYTQTTCVSRHSQPPGTGCTRHQRPSSIPRGGLCYSSGFISQPDSRLLSPRPLVLAFRSSGSEFRANKQKQTNKNAWDICQHLQFFFHSRNTKSTATLFYCSPHLLILQPEKCLSFGVSGMPRSQNITLSF